MKRILLITGLMITLSVSGSALKVIGKIYHLQGIKHRNSTEDHGASIASNKFTTQGTKATTCGHYHRKTYE